MIPPVIDQGRTGGPAAPPARPSPARPRLSAGPATIILVVFLATQFGAVVMVSMVAGFFVGVMHAAHHVTTPISQEIAQSLPWILGWGAIFGTLAGGMAVAKVSASMLREHLGDASAFGAAWVYGAVSNTPGVHPVTHKDLRRCSDLYGCFPSSLSMPSDIDSV